METRDYNSEDIFVDEQRILKVVEGVKYDGEKPDYMLVPLPALNEAVKVLTFGAKKYSPDNWRRVPDARRRYLSALFRHVVAYCMGERLDPESGLHHLAHALCCLLFVLEFDLEEGTHD